MTYPFVSLIIPTYLKEAERYLHLCLESIENLNYPKDRFETIVVSSDHMPEIDQQNIIHFHNNERLHYASAINKGVELANTNTDYYFLLSDDVILTKDSLMNLITLENNQGVLIQGISNCDNAFYRKYAFAFPHQQGGIQYRFNDWAPIKEQLMNAESLYPPGFIAYSHLCFYAVLINKKKIWDRVGKLDDTFKSGQEDFDYCNRARQLNIPSGVATHSLIWHFSGVTADLTLDKKTREENMNYFREKWK